jgi:cytochrome c-type biogenesis protein CcmH/NrfG
VGDERDRVDEFEGAWKAWAERPARRSPPEAGRRVLEATRRRQRRRRTVRTLLATAALLAIALTVGLHQQVPTPEPAAPPLASAPLKAGQALIWLDAETPLYMTFEAPPPAPGDRP